MNEIPQELLDELILGELCYPIYHVELKWSQDIRADRPDDWFTPTEGLPKGRMWNGTGWNTMPAERTSENELLCDARDQMTNAFGGEKYRDLNPDQLTVSIEFRRWDTWCSGWFSHWTWDTSLLKSGFVDVLRSFGRYVDRIEEHNHLVGDDNICLMGAEDRYRWHGTHTGDPSERTDPPCRCPHCTKRGIITIGH